jgi:peptidoglycan/xylan/chitin deacetylase (PgdA/CDA1 family)
LILLLAALALAHPVPRVKPVPVGDTHGRDPGWQRTGTPPVDPAVVPAIAAAAVPAEVVEHGPRTRPRVALTFDACPTAVEHGGFRRDIVDWLRANGVKATFFVSSRWGQWRPEVVQELAAEPLFEVESHAATHVDLTRLPAERLRENLDESQRVLAAILGHAPSFLRPPKATVSPLLAAEAASKGLTVVTMDVISADAEVHFKDATVVHEVLSRVKPGSIVGMHFNGQAIHTLGALPAIVAGLRAKGYELVTVHELIGAPGAVAAGKHDAEGGSSL